MKKDVLITLKSIQSEDGQSSETELITSGKYKKTADGFEVSYEESEATGFSGSVTTLTTYGDSKVIMNRSGKASSQLIIERGTKHRCHYGTPYGDFMVGITAGEINSSLSKEGGDLNFKYVIDINSSYVSDFEIKLNIKTTEQ